MTRVAVLHHLERPFTGLAGRGLRAAGIELDERDLLRGDPLPELGEVDGLLSLGGDQSVREIDRYPYLEAEAELLRSAVERGLPVLGICLGGQLLAHALGAPVRRVPDPDVGWAEVAHTPAAADDPLGAALPDPAPALHWNEDCFEVPDGAVELLARAGPGGELFRAGACAWGAQYHPDVDGEVLESWYRDFPDYLERLGADEAELRQADARHMAAHERAAEALFEAFGAVVRRRAGSRAA